MSKIATHCKNHVFQIFISGLPGGLAGKESTCIVGDLGSIPVLGRSPGEEKDYPRQYSGLKNSMDCIVCGVAKSRTQLNDFRFHNTWQLPLFLIIVDLRSSSIAASEFKDFGYKGLCQESKKITQRVVENICRTFICQETCIQNF